jgi:hypothetical protein
MTIREAKADMRRQIDEAKKRLSEKSQEVHGDLFNAVVKSCALVEGTSKRLMRDTVVDMEKTYGKRGHHPSLPGYSPATDNGTMIRSITHDVTDLGPYGIIGRVGSVLKDPPYPVYLENGTSNVDGSVKMEPRPWLLPSLDNNKEKIESMIEGAVRGTAVQINIDATE